MEPTTTLNLLLGSGVTQRVGVIVQLEKILDNRAGLPDRGAGVGVFDGGHAAVGVDGFKGLFFEVAEVFEDGFVLLFTRKLSDLRRMLGSVGMGWSWMYVREDGMGWSWMDVREHPTHS
jgi:hypothetical protein